ncbi:MAG: histidine kinase [Rhodobacteraceae bacterium]|nr:MAG: histidine kinase [Paracoccaceae bacterium]
MNGKLIAGFIVVLALVFGAGLYYTQVYAYYDRLDASAPAAAIRATSFEGLSEDILAEDFEGIDADTSPLKFRACFTTPLSVAMMTETFRPYARPSPLIAPSWFSCFDAKRIGADLEAGRAVAFMGEENITYGFDRVIAVYPDGHGYAWTQANRCGEAVFDGKPAPAGCPPAPEGN